MRALKEPARTLAWDDFRLIKAIADRRALPAAATALGLNHSTVFRRLGQIEQALGLKLFERHRSGYVATPAGDEMVPSGARLTVMIRVAGVGSARPCASVTVKVKLSLPK